MLCLDVVYQHHNNLTQSHADRQSDHYITPYRKSMILLITGEKCQICMEIVSKTSHKFWLFLTPPPLLPLSVTSCMNVSMATH